MLSLQTSNDDLCWLVDLCPRSRTASSIQGQSVPGRDGGSPAAPAAPAGMSSAPPMPHAREQRGPPRTATGPPETTLRAAGCCWSPGGESTAAGGFVSLFAVAQLLVSQKKLYLFVPHYFLAQNITFILTFPLFTSFPPHHTMTSTSPETILPPCCLFCIYASLHLGCEPNKPLSSKKLAME